MNTVLAFFPDLSKGETVTSELKNLGFAPREVEGLMIKDFYSESANGDIGTKGGASSNFDVSHKTARRALVGAVAGVVLGFIVVLLWGVNINVNGISFLVASTGLLDVLFGVLIGGITGSVLGLLIDSWLEFYELEVFSEMYTRKSERGGLILAVPARGGIDTYIVRGVLENHNVDEVKVVRDIDLSLMLA